MTRYFILNEFNLPRLIWACWRRKPVVVLQCWPVLSVSNRLLRQIVAGLRDAGRILPTFAGRHGWERFDVAQGGAEAYGYYTDVFARIENWHDQYFAFDRLDDRLPDYAQAARHRIASHYPDIHWLILALADLETGEDAVLIGSFAEIEGFYTAYHGRAFPKTKRHRAIEWRRMVNAGLAAAATAFTFLWAIRHTVWRPPVPQHHPLATELLQVFRHLNLNREMVERDEDCLCVFRTPWFQNTYRDRIGAMAHCLQTDGNISASELPGILWLVVRDCLRLYSRFARLQPGLFRRITSLVYWRVVYRALLNRYPCDFFLGRDDYNGQHAVRSQELRRINAVSLGIAHGLPTTNTIHPVTRYLDFDIYYIFGQDIYERYYRRTYAPKMTVRAVGSIGMNREQLDLVHMPRPKNIIIYLSDDMESPEITDAMQQLARHFFDRKVLVKIKESQFDHGCADQFVDAIAAGPDNLIDDRRDSYEMMLEARYAVSNNSTIAAEAIFYGLNTFVFDVYDRVMPDPHPMLFRDYPDICQPTAEAIIERIEAIESGRWQYPTKALVGLAGNIDQNPFDFIRQDLGLPPRPTDRDMPTRVIA